MKQLFFQHGRGIEITFFGLLAHAEVPPPVLNYISVKNVRAHIERIVFLGTLLPVDGFILGKYLPGQKHANGFSADKARAYHPGLYLQYVLQGKVRPRQGKHLLVLGYQDIAETVHQLLLFLLGSRFLYEFFRFEEQPVPVIKIPPGPFRTGFIYMRKDPRGIDAVSDGNVLVLVPEMRQEHGRRITVPDLQRVYVILAVTVISIYQKLRCLPDTRYGLERMTVPQEGKIGDGLQLVKERARYHEEVAHHKIRRPRRKEFGQAVEHVISAYAFFGYYLVDLGGKGLEPGTGIQFVLFDPVRIFQQGFMRREPDIYDLFVLV